MLPEIVVYDVVAILVLLEMELIFGYVNKLKSQTIREYIYVSNLLCRWDFNYINCIPKRNQIRNFDNIRLHTDIMKPLQNFKTFMVRCQDIPAHDYKKVRSLCWYLRCLNRWSHIQNWSQFHPHKSIHIGGYFRTLSDFSNLLQATPL